MHHATSKHDHYHAVVDTQWRSVESPVFAHEGASITSAARGYEVVRHPLTEATQPMPMEIAAQYGDLIALAQLASPAAIARLEMLSSRYPEAAILSNLQAAAYSRAGRMREALAVAELAVEESPHYLFARIQYAQLCLLAGRPDAVPAIFDNHFDLKLLYPHRTQYHISEFAAFAAVVGEYYLLKGDRRAAESLCNTLTHVAPGHELTRRLQSLMGDGE